MTRTRITYIKVPLGGQPSGPWHLSTDHAFSKHTTDDAGPYKEVREYLCTFNKGCTSRSFDVLEVIDVPDAV
jgi:hypothetical protein